MGRQSRGSPVLRVPLDLSSPVDSEVYKILQGVSSKTELKHYLCSAVLYYARSPLVLSASVMEKLSNLLEKTYKVLQENKKAANVRSKSDEVAFGMTMDEIIDVAENHPVLHAEDGVRPYKEVFPVSTGSKGALSSLKEKFKV